MSRRERHRQAGTNSNVEMGNNIKQRDTGTKEPKPQTAQERQKGNAEQRKVN